LVARARPEGHRHPSEHHYLRHPQPANVSQRGNPARERYRRETLKPFPSRDRGNDIGPNIVAKRETLSDRSTALRVVVAFPPKRDSYARLKQVTLEAFQHTAAIHSSDGASSSMTTAAGLPLNGLSVKESTVLRRTSATCRT
jgi:hypothetical protein